MSESKKPEVEEKATISCDYCGEKRKPSDLHSKVYWYSGRRTNGDFCKDKPCAQYMNMGGH